MSRDIQMSPVEQEHERLVPDHEDKDFSSDTVSLGGASKAGADTVEEPTVAESPIRLRPRGRQEAFASLDVVDLNSVLSRRAHLLRPIPFVLKDAFRLALGIDLDEVVAGHEQGSESRMAKGWKLFMFLPRLLPHRPSKKGNGTQENFGGEGVLFPGGCVVAAS